MIETPEGLHSPLSLTLRLDLKASATIHWLGDLGKELTFRGFPLFLPVT